MGLWNWLFGRTEALTLDSDKRAASFGTVVIPWLDQDDPSIVNRVSREQALGVPAVLRGRNLICGTIGSLPLYTLDKDNHIVDQPLLRQIDPDVPNTVTISATVEDLLFEGIAWWEILSRGWDNYPTSCRQVAASMVSTQPPENYTTNPLPSGYVPGSSLWINGREVPGRNVIRFDSPLPPLLVHSARTIRRALRVEITADNLANDPAAREYFTPREGSDPDEDDVIDLLDNWKAARQARSSGYVPSAFDRKDIINPTPADLQLIDIQKQITLGLANAMGLDPEDLGVSTTSRTYQNAVDRRQDRVNECYSPFLSAIQDRLSMGDVTRRGQVVRFDLDDFLKADPKTRAETQQIYHGMQALTVGEVRKEERMPPLAEKPQPVAEPTRPVLRIASGDRAPLTFSNDLVGLAFDSDGVDQSFQVDEARRIITGLVVPWGAVGHSGGRQWRFEPGSLKFNAGAVSRIKLLMDHDNAQAVGKVIKTWSDEQGQWATFKVGRGAEGDRALAMAADGVRDGLSVGIGDNSNDPNVITIPDPQNPAVTLITSAPWRETSLVSMPAFSDSRVATVTMSDDAERTTFAMKCTKCGHDHAPGTPCATPEPQTFSAADIQKLITDGITAGFAAQQGGPTPVNPVARPVPGAPTSQPLVVREPAPYRFDGGRSQYDFSTDLFASLKDPSRNGEATQRIEKFMRLAFDVDTTDVAGMNPNGFRPDMYVDQRDYRYPLWDAVKSGNLTDNTPFTVPKFNSSSGLVANHTQGTEPTPGAFTATSQTITPTGVSGKVEITREVWDAGGNPQVSGLIWRQMIRAWYEALEAYVVSILDAASPTGITITTAAADKALAKEVAQKLGALQFVRGGFVFDTFALQVDLYNALIAAVDDSGRPLFPILGPQNANGQSAPLWGELNVGGLRAFPEWALAATGTAAASSYLFDRNSVHGWASTPQRFEFQYRVAYVDLAIWGYKAAAITDLTGVREVIYDPAA